MYWKIYFGEYKESWCIECCKTLIKNKIEIIQKEYCSIMVKTDMPYTDILNICLNYDVANITPCRMENFKERIIKQWEIMKNKQK